MLSQLQQQTGVLEPTPGLPWLPLMVSRTLPAESRQIPVGRKCPQDSAGSTTEKPAINQSNGGSWVPAEPGSLVLDQVAARHRHTLDQRHRATFVQVPGRVLLVEGVLRRHAIDRHDRLKPRSVAPWVEPATAPCA